MWRLPGRWALLLLGFGAVGWAPLPGGSAPAPGAFPSSFSVDTLRLTLEVSSQVSLGELVSVLLTVENTSGGGMDLYLRGREVTADLVVTREDDDQPVWRRLEGAIVPAIVRVERLEAGSSLEVPMGWPQRDQAGAWVPPGLYRIWAELLTEGPPLTSESRVVRLLPGG